MSRNIELNPKARSLLFPVVVLSILMVVLEVGNFFSTYYALNDILGTIGLTIFGTHVRWAVMMAVAACLMDFFGIVRIFTPHQDRDEPAEVWILFGIWVVMAVGDAVLTWWTSKTAIIINPSPSVLLSSSAFIYKAVPVVVAGIELALRVSVVFLFGKFMDKFIHEIRKSGPISRPVPTSHRIPSLRPGPTTASRPPAPAASRPLYGEPTYHPVGMGKPAPKPTGIPFLNEILGKENGSKTQS